MYPTPRFLPLCDLPSPYLFGMVKNSGPSHNGLSEAVCGRVGTHSTSVVEHEGKACLKRYE